MNGTYNNFITLVSELYTYAPQKNSLREHSTIRGQIFRVRRLTTEREIERSSHGNNKIYNN
jgi:hypothetical protein